MQTTLSGTEALPKDYATNQAYERLTAAFPQQGTTNDVVVKTPASASPSNGDP